MSSIVINDVLVPLCNEIATLFFGAATQAKVLFESDDVSLTLSLRETRRIVDVRVIAYVTLDRLGDPRADLIAD